MTKKDMFEWLTIGVSTVAIITSSLSVFVSIYLKKEVDIKLSQYTLASEEQNRILKNLFDLEDFIDLIISKYNVGRNVNEIYSKITNEEKLSINKYISEINQGLSKLFITMEDQKYEIIAKNWPTQEGKLHELRSHISILMRQTQHPKTTFLKAEDIKIIHKID